MSLPPLRTACVTLSVLASSASPAFALPSLTADRACYGEQEPITLTGQGFTAGAPITLLLAANGSAGQSSTTSDAVGAFTYRFAAPKLDDFKLKGERFDLGITANDQTKFGPSGPIGPPEESFAASQIRISRWLVDVPSWNSARAKATRGQRVNLTTRGWTSLGDMLYIHYLRAGKVVASEKLGALTGDCGDLRRKVKVFNSKSLKPGTYAVRFSAWPVWDADDAWLGYRRIKLVA